MKKKKVVEWIRDLLQADKVVRSAGKVENHRIVDDRMETYSFKESLRFLDGGKRLIVVLAIIVYSRDVDWSSWTVSRTDIEMQSCF